MALTLLLLQDAPTSMRVSGGQEKGRVSAALSSGRTLSSSRSNSPEKISAKHAGAPGGLELLVSSRSLIT